VALNTIQSTNQSRDLRRALDHEFMNFIFRLSCYTPSILGEKEGLVWSAGVGIMCPDAVTCSPRVTFSVN